MREIPVVDMRSPDLASLSDDERQRQLGDRIMHALRGIGFVYLKNTDISNALRQATVDTALEFFALPIEEKMRYHRFVKTKGANGYTPMSEEQLGYSEKGYEERGAVELKESWDIMVADEELPSDIAPAFSDNVIKLMTALEKLSQYVYAAVEEAMGRPGMLTVTHLRQMGRDNASVMRVVHYPPVPESVPVGAVRCSTHSDWGSITLLLQDNVGGLEVLARDDNWVPATPIPETVLVNVGDLMEIWTGGEVRATKHRVRYPESQRQRNAHRVSLVFFGQPDDETTVAPPPHAQGVTAVNAGEYLKAKYLASMPNSG